MKKEKEKTTSGEEMKKEKITRREAMRLILAGIAGGAVGTVLGAGGYASLKREPVSEKTETEGPKETETPEPKTTVTSEALSKWPQTPENFLAWVTESQPESNGSWLPIELNEIHQPPEESDAWAVTREKDLTGNITPFWVQNPTDCMQDGWMDSLEDREQLGRQSPESARGSGIPADWSGLAQGATFRPCNQ